MALAKVMLLTDLILILPRGSYLFSFLGEVGDVL